VAYRAGFEELDVRGKGGIREEVDQVYAETVITEQNIAHAKNQNFPGRRTGASPELFLCCHLTLF
jgi:hypothetical protein